jgi:hypothetical protein
MIRWKRESGSILGGGYALDTAVSSIFFFQLVRHFFVVSSSISVPLSIYQRRMSGIAK